MENVLEYLLQCSRSFPDKIAVSCRDEYLTFSALEQQARRLAAAIPQGMKNCPVGVFADRDVATAVFFLATVFSGNYYVPLDPQLPTGKLQSIFDDAQFSVVFGDETARQRLDELDFSGTFLMTESAADAMCKYPQISAQTPLYMVYTSGSTGKPKGVLKSHGAVISFIEAFCDTFAFSHDETIGNQTPFFFDASAKDFYLMLKTGATLEIIPTECFAMPTTLINYLNEKRITFISWVPTALSIVAQLNTFSFITPEYLRRVFFVGEVMPMKHLNKWRAALPNISYVNLYGASELAGICCWYEVKKDFADTDVLPIGKPLKNCELYLLDGDTVIREPGQIGELWLSSPALALEYFRDPEKTAASFAQRDFGNGEKRCFRTGDLAQYDEDGNLIFASRADFQIKHLGHRIELGEIEAVAGSLPDVARCCCLYQSEKSKLVLFCELADGSGIEKGQQLQHLLRPLLSSYMLPGKVVLLPKLPLNANGKIDRQQLKTLL